MRPQPTMQQHEYAVQLSIEQQQELYQLAQAQRHMGQLAFSASNSAYSSPMPHGMHYAHSPYSVLSNEDELRVGSYYNTHASEPSRRASPLSTRASPAVALRAGSERGDVLKTRSGRKISRATPARTKGHRNEKSSKPKKPRPIKTDKTKTPRLTAPLSILTEDLRHIPVRDMNAWVHRSVSTRIREVEDRGGKIPRPMNSFMLYRSAYAERTKAWCDQNNHQVVSSVSGESWPMEPKEVRDMYNEYAKIERLNHQRAYPDYKFTPAKPGVPSRKRKSESPATEASSQAINLDEPDAEWLPAGHRGRQTTPTRLEAPGFHGEAPHAAFAADAFGVKRASDMPQVIMQGFHPVPSSIQQRHADPYYHIAAQQAPKMPQTGHVQFNTLYATDHTLSGMPGGLHSDLFHEPEENLELHPEHQIDPALSEYMGAVSMGLTATTMAQHAPSTHGYQHIEDIEIGREMIPNYPSVFHSEHWQGHQQDNIPHDLEGTELEFNKWHD